MKEELIVLEASIDEAIKNRKMKQKENQQKIDRYYQLLIDILNEINEIDSTDRQLDYDKKPLNFNDRIEYFESHKYQYMGYKQIKTMMREVLKLKAVHDLKKKK
ncbi:hypothetical protein C7R57_01350 [Macrococcoides caseolyticum subsp. caseolyticum]|uniref:YpoC family protein n=1 Tax=Macrococcoides caseolyticum TaxID=69966 RepID=UPI000CD27BCD|nr:hypothetical protein [Macrococcus caseolyticus]PNZ72608.1 hypothetical protein CD152_07190 [Macrococcus caseolyticus]QPT47155.1 hypothetical protein I6G25_02550 [Macrococcus caseolyticus]RAK48300.1 hypothetical protein C7R57_01350 [Macrococcus caseolyticus subsp. caseolyticus]HCD18196.1 hypothetical protein [Macrococcus caseolyticus]